ncbi:unnamed protein product [Rhizoctonia solani]|uniref:DUF5648 domain-containing protein n=1 Tax=Rhizoctonia solani TaxID=456999 RepID=A0A8H3BK23_9AGAM|nr:unnamed protein product [Rhizoctonia solani]
MPDHYYSLSSDIPPSYGKEGVACLVFAGNQPEISTVGVYRFYNSSNGDHYYTTDKGLASFLQGRGYVIENGGEPVFYVFERPLGCDTVPFYQWQNGTDHFYTTNSTGELAPWIGGHYQGILGHVFPASAAVVGSRKPLYRFYKG